MSEEIDTIDELETASDQETWTRTKSEKDR